MTWPERCEKCGWKPDNKYTALARDKTGKWVCLKDAVLP